MTRFKRIDRWLYWTIGPMVWHPTIFEVEASDKWAHLRDHSQYLPTLNLCKRMRS